MNDFLATLAICGAASVVTFVIIHFSSRQKAIEKTRDIEELKRKLFEKIEQDVREVRETYVEHH